MKEVYNVELSNDASMSEFVDAYMTAKKAKAKIYYPQSMDFINLDLTPVCNLKCASCNHFVDTAPGNISDNLTFEQVQDFIKESQELQWQWTELRLTGGEPSLHPDFYKIMDALTQGFKKDYLPNITLKVISNGTGKKVRGLLGWDEAEVFSMNKYTDSFYLSHQGRPEWQIVSSKPLKDTMQEEIISTKDVEEAVDVIPDFGNVWLAPMDRLPELDKFYKGDRGQIDPSDGYFPPNLTQEDGKEIVENTLIMDCQVHATCGFELTPYGYTPCPCGGGRVVGDESIFFKRLADISVEKCDDILKKMCSMCGRNLNYGVLCKNNMEKTEFWGLILDKYRRQKPDLARYNPYNR